ncbi:carboxypeptidase-like regulatory domain-containing protein [Aquimarina sp. MAR_2010_214]|uniref:carboxypeptidase-like regulatory domain-containing protein n=1 Tax=Aquimarina sp. MAR_2010_214 TaxID=1250026 RepID=UPI000C7035F9|nr:carboxypeptidase-like regulatory domain-containing protein [Aquimarina sp. MAR_2010_214]
MLCNAQSSLTGVILDQNSNPVPEASIQILELKNRETVSDFDDKFNLEILPGSYTLKVVYKEIVPVYLRADTLGGVVNIICFHDQNL